MRPEALLHSRCTVGLYDGITQPVLTGPRLASALCNEQTAVASVLCLPWNTIMRQSAHWAVGETLFLSHSDEEEGKNPSREMILDQEEFVETLGVDEGCKVAVLPSSLIERQDGEIEGVHRSLTLLADVRAWRSAVLRDSMLREIWTIGSKGGPPESTAPAVNPTVVLENAQQVSVICPLKSASPKDVQKTISLCSLRGRIKWL